MSIAKSLEKAHTLLEALPYIRSFYNKTLVIKYGGSAMAEREFRLNFARDVTLLKFVGMNPVVVHGGGPQIGQAMARMGKKMEFVNGLRVTDEETMAIVEMVLVGSINKELVALINQEGGRAVGLCGKDGDLIQASRIRVEDMEWGGEKLANVDMGLVGRVEAVQPQIIRVLEANGFIPVIAPTGMGRAGETYNINADLAAGEIAASLQAERLLILTDVAGIVGKDHTLLSTLKREEVSYLIDSGVIGGGMLPKVHSCLRALERGVHKTHIIDGRLQHALLLELFTDEGIGTEIVQ